MRRGGLEVRSAPPVLCQQSDNETVIATWTPEKGGNKWLSYQRSDIETVIATSIYAATAALADPLSTIGLSTTEYVAPRGVAPKNGCSAMVEPDTAHPY